MISWKMKNICKNEQQLSPSALVESSIWETQEKNAINKFADFFVSMSVDV